MNPVTSLLMTTNWWFVVVCTLISFVIGALRYSKAVFGNLYIRLMKVPADMPRPNGKEMAKQFSLEIFSRLLYFLGIGQIFQVTGRPTVQMGLVLAVVVFVIFVFPTQLSAITWSWADRRVVWLLAGKVLLDTLIATLLWYWVF